MKFLKKHLDKIFLILILAISTVILFASIKGLPGNPNQDTLNTSVWKENGPFELSPERGRFALTYSIVENNSVLFSIPVSRFSTPDLGYWNGHFVSLFAPLLSYIVIPGYIIGKLFGASQAGTFSVIAIFALINMLLIRSISLRLGANKIAATVASLIFLFATPAYTYATTLYQHHISTFLILLSIYALLKSTRMISLGLVFFLCSLSIPLDYPNLFIMTPIGLVALGKIISASNINDKLSIKFNLFKSLALLAAIVPLVFFLWFNNASYGNPLKISGTVPYIANLDAKGNPVGTKPKEDVKTLKEISNLKEISAITYFNTRNILNGLYLNFISPDRGILYFTPIMFFGFLGFIVAYRKKTQMIPLLISIVGVNFLLYEMWGDPWGGWAFGSRYLIPSYAILTVFIALLLTYWKKLAILAIFIPVLIYSLAVNTLGAITTDSMPPQIQTLALEKASGSVEKYTWIRNWDYIFNQGSKSFAYQTFLKNTLTAPEFYWILSIALIVLVNSLLFIYFYEDIKKAGIKYVQQ